MAALFTSTASLHGPATVLRPLPAEAKEQWYGVYAQGRKVGYSHRTRTPTAEGFTVANDTWTRLGMLGTTQLVITHLVAETDPSLRLRRFDFHLRSGGVDFAISGAADGDALKIRSTSLGPRDVRLPMSGPITLSQTLQDLLGQEEIETGRTYRYTMFDPVSAAPAPVSLTIGAIEQVSLPGGARSAYRVDEDFQGSRFRLWVEPNGAVIKEEGPLGLTLLREIDANAATAGIDPDASVDFIAAAAVRVARPIPAPRELRRLRLKITEAAALGSLSFPPRQHVEDGWLVIEREDAAAQRSVTLPVREADLADDLRATPFLQIDDPKVRVLAREIVGSESNAGAAARKLLDWVFRNLTKRATASIPNALQVIEERAGDCNEHAVLYAALARAAGLPARMMAGTVYMDGDDGSPGAFYYHAWNQVWLGEWISVDPTFGQFPADATHVALIEGGPEKDIALLGVIGRIRFEVGSFG